MSIEVSPRVGDIVVKLGLFSKQDQKSQTCRQSSIQSINNLGSHLEVFQTILEQVTKTSNEAKFLKILLHLLQIDSNEGLCNDIWEVGEKLLHRATQVEGSEDAKCLLRSTETHRFLCQQCSANNYEKVEEGEGKGSSRELPEIEPEPSASLSTTLSIIPDLIPDTKLTVIPTGGGLPPPPPPIGLPKITLPNTPKPSKKLKFFNWTKKTPFQITKQKSCIWSKVNNIGGYNCNYSIIEELFYAQTFDKNCKDQVDGGNSNKPIQLLSNQLSLQIDIFLTQFKGYSSDDVAQMIRCGNSKTMDLDKLYDLKKILKKKDQLEILKDFKGERQRLARAERFLISILDLSKYELRITCMVFKEEFVFNIKNFEVSMDAILKAGKDLVESESIVKILHIIMTIGNFLNYGGFMGNCSGFSIDSLNSLTDTKANKANMHLLHFIVQEVEKYNHHLKDFYKDFSHLSLVSKINLDKIETDIKGLEMARNSTQAEVDSCETPEDIKQQMTDFLQDAQIKILDLKTKFENINELRVELANYFCEDVKKFELKQCFEIFRTFCEQFKEAIKENKERQELETRAEKRRKYEEEQMAKRKIHRFPGKGRGRVPKNPLNINCSLIESEANNTNSFINSKKNDEDLMAQLEKASDEELRKMGKTRNTKRPALQKFQFQPERTLCSANFHDHNVETPLANLKPFTSEGQEKENRFQKPWKRLLERYRANKCLTPEITNRRPSLQIYIRSNSTVDNRTEFSKRTRSSPSSSSQITNKSDEGKQKFGQSKKSKSPLTIKIPNDTYEAHNMDYRRRSMSAMPRYSRCRFSSINEGDLRRTLKNLRTPTIEGTNFCFSPVRDSNALNFMAFPPTLAKPSKRNIEDLGNLEEKNNSKLVTASESQNALEKDISTYDSKSNESKTSNILTAVISESKETQILDSNPTKQENSKQFEITPKPNLSQRIVTKLQNTLKAISRPTSHENLLNSRHRSIDVLYHSPSQSESSQISKSSAEVLNKPTFSQRLAKRFRALSLLNIQYHEGASFQSYVDFKDHEKENSSTKLNDTKFNKHQSSITNDSNRMDNEIMKNSSQKN
ncbi:uncharacterized protein ACRADG_003542 isoform 2-T2 [Cochliomyia hominivorax]